MWTRRIRRMILPCLLLVFTAGKSFAQTVSDATPHQSLDDAWWTGPMLANSAHTLPQGHGLIESYLYDAISGRTNGVNSLTYLLYGLTDRLTIGLVPTAGYNSVRGGPDSSGVQSGRHGNCGRNMRSPRWTRRSGIPDIRSH